MQSGINTYTSRASLKGFHGGASLGETGIPVEGKFTIDLAAQSYVLQTLLNQPTRWSSWPNFLSTENTGSNHGCGRKPKPLSP